MDAAPSHHHHRAGVGAHQTHQTHRSAHRNSPARDSAPPNSRPTRLPFTPDVVYHANSEHAFSVADRSSAVIAVQSSPPSVFRCRRMSHIHRRRLNARAPGSALHFLRSFSSPLSKSSQINRNPRLTSRKASLQSAEFDRFVLMQHSSFAPRMES
jgi:hypothetical protein